MDLKKIATNITRIAPLIKVSVGKKRVNFCGSFIINPGSYKFFPKEVRELSRDADRVILFTEKQYENNFFFDSPGKEIIVSLAGWDYLTKIPKNNGAVFFIAALAIRFLKIGSSHSEISGCVNDFWQDKRGVDVSMRSAFICPECRGTGKLHTALIGQLQKVLDDLSLTSRQETDICSYWKTFPAAEPDFDVFICHNTEDKPEVRKLCAKLRERKIRFWLDEEQLPPGRAWQELLEKQISKIKSAAVCVGANGLGPWQNQEMRCFLQEFVRRQCAVIPVMLGSNKKAPELPIFLRQMTWVDFRKTKPAPLDRLVWGITGKRPDSLFTGR